MKKETGILEKGGFSRPAPRDTRLRLRMAVFCMAWLPVTHVLGGDVLQNTPDMPAKAETRGEGLPVAQGNTVHGQKNGHHNPLAELAEALAAAPGEGNMTRHALLSAARRGDYLPAITWSISRGDWGLAQFLVHADPQPAPRWIQMSLALHSRNLQELQRLVFNPESLPPRDLFHAYVDLGEYWQARGVAMKRLRVNPDDREIRREYLEIVRLTADSAGLSGMWQSFGGLQLYGPKAELEMHFHRSRWGFRVKNRTLWPSAGAAAYLQNLPKMMDFLEAGIFREGQNWHASLALGQFRAMRNTLTARGSAYLQMTRDTGVSATLEYHDQSFQSPALAVAGMADRVRLLVSHQTGAWNLEGGGGWTQYQGQDGVVLGSDRYVRAGASWQSALGPWRLRLGPFASFHAMHRSGEVRGIVSSVLLPGERNMDYVLPLTYADCGLHLAWGTKTREPEAGWTPYLGVSVYENTRYGFQYQLDAGISTPVVGPDQLSLDFSQGQGGNGLALNQRSVELGYRIYF